MTLKLVDELDNKQQIAGRLTIDECNRQSSPSNRMTAIASDAVQRARKLTQFATIKHFLDVYLFLIILILITTGLNYLFKEHVAGCSDVVCYWGPCA